MKTIIACTDFSTPASNAVQYAASLAKATHSRLLLFHYFSYPVPATDLPMAFSSLAADEMAKGFEQQLKALTKTLVDTYGITVDHVVRSWDFALDLEEVYQKEKAEWVVMGLQGHSALVNVLVGSISSSMIRRGRLPLLLVPRGVSFHPFKKIVFPCDDQGIETAETIRPLLDLALHFEAYIEVLTLFDLEKTPGLVPQAQLSDAKRHLDTLLAKTKHGFSYENESAVDKGILYEAARSKADLVAMIPHHHSFWSNLLRPSETQRVAAAIHLPLLVLGENKTNN